MRRCAQTRFAIDYHGRLQNKHVAGDVHTSCSYFLTQVKEMEKSFTKTLGSLWPRPCAAISHRQKPTERLDDDRNVRARGRVLTDTLLKNSLSFKVEGNSYITTQRSLVSLQLPASIRRIYDLSVPFLRAHVLLRDRIVPWPH